jgi:hypothetical protein
MYLLIQNFNEGLDTRKMFLTAKAGTLQKCNNAHITRGGEIEKRLAFAPYATLPTGTFGLQAASGSLYTFGSATKPSNFPANLNYLRLQHTDGTTAMTDILYSETFNGQIYVIAQYADGAIFHFYNPIPTNVPTATLTIAYGSTYTSSVIQVGGTPIMSAAFTTPGGTTTANAASVASAINSYTSTSGFTASSNAAIVTVFAPLGSSSIWSGKTVNYFNGATGVTTTMVGGPRVLAWDTISGNSGNNSGIASDIATKINLDPYFTATASESTITITGKTANSFTVTPSVVNGGAVNDQTVTVATTQTVTSGVSASVSLNVYKVAYPGTITISKNPSYENIPIVSIPTAPTETATRDALVAAINSSNTGFTATTSTGNFFTLYAPSNYGIAGNSTFIGWDGHWDGTSGSFLYPNLTGGQITGVALLSGGSDAKPQITTATIGGTFEAGDTYLLVLYIPSLNYSVTYKHASYSTSVAKIARTFGTKVYTTANSLLYFTDINNPSSYSYLSTPLTPNGSGFINLSNQDSGFETLQGLGIYQGKLAVLSRRAVQIWGMDPDPTKNLAQQTLKNIGTFAPRSVTNFGDIDVFFLSDSGIRSLRARDASNYAAISDVGTNIDDLILSDLSLLDEKTKSNAVGVIEPKDGRYWLAVGPKIYVYSYFPTPGIAAWSTYEPGFTVTHFAYANSQIYARATNNNGTSSVYLYGGTDGKTYDNSQVEVILPYLDAGKPAHTKSLQAIDLTCLGTWDIFAGCDTTVPDIKDFVATVNQSTFDLSRIQAAGIGTHIGIRMTTNTQYSGPAKIGNFAAHFDINDAG